MQKLGSFHLLCDCWCLLPHFLLFLPGSCDCIPLFSGSYLVVLLVIPENIKTYQDPMAFQTKGLFYSPHLLCLLLFRPIVSAFQIILGCIPDEIQ